VVPNPTVTYTSPNTTWSLGFTPVAGAFGSATISVTVNDGQPQSNTVTRTFTVTVNDPPTISPIASQNTAPGTATLPIPFTIGDPETSAASLTLSGSSANTNVVANSGIAFSGSASNRFVVLTPLSVQSNVDITITVSDGIATASTTFNLLVAQQRPPPPTLLLVTNGNGSFSPNLNSQVLTTGKTYTVTAIPASGAEFVGWTGSATSSSPTISFVLAADTHLVATFVPSTFSAAKGAFNGLFYDVDQVQQQSSGCFTISTTPRGTYSGRLQIGAGRYSFHGQLNSAGEGTNVVSRKDGAPLTLELRVGSGAQADRIFGRVTDGTWVAMLTGDKNVFSGQLNPTSGAGNYTIVIPGVSGDGSLPAGDGYGTVRVAPSGQVRFAGVLADGTKVSQSAPISKDGEWPMYAGLYKGSGSVLGWMNFARRTNDDINGTLNWIKLPTAGGLYYAGGFTHQYDAVGSTYAKPAANGSGLTLTDADLIFSGGNLASDMTNSVAVASAHLKSDGSDGLKLDFTSSKGTFRGRVDDPASGTPLSFGGVVFQKQNVGCGSLLGVSQSSRVLIAK